MEDQALEGQGLGLKPFALITAFKKQAPQRAPVLFQPNSPIGAYDRYQARFFDVFRKFQGRLLSADESPAVLEGAWDRDKLVLMSFPDEAAFRAWVGLAGVPGNLEDRKAGAQGIVLLAKGFTPG